MIKQNENTSEQVGFHKGAISTLAKERQELAKMLNIVEQIMQMHVSALKNLGVDLEEMAKSEKSKSVEDKIN